MTLEFLILSIIFLVGMIYTNKVFYVCTQDDQILDKLFKWNAIRDKFGMKPGLFNDWIYRVMNGCSFCFSFWWSVLWFIAYTLIFHYGLHIWIYLDNGVWQWVFNIFWFSIIVNTSTVISTRLIDK